MKTCQHCHDEIKEPFEVLCIDCKPKAKPGKKSKQECVYVARDTGCRDPYPPTYYHIKGLKEAEDYLKAIGLRD
jgi:hypothetical protein